MSRIGPFVRRLFREQPLRITLLVVALGVAGLLEGVAIASLVPLLDLLGGSSGDTGAIGQVARNFIEALGLPLTLGTVLGFVLLVLIVQQAVVLGEQKLSFGSVFRFEAALRRDLYRAVFEASWPFFYSERSGALVTALTQEAQRAGMAYTYLAQLAGITIVLSVYLTLAFTLSWQMTLLVVVVALVVATLLRRRVRAGTRFGSEITDANAELQSEALENVGGAKLIKGTSSEKQATDRFERFVDQLAMRQYRAKMNAAWIKVLSDAIGLTVVLGGVYMAVTRFGMPLSKLVVFLLIFYRVSPRLTNAQVLFNSFLQYLPALDRIDEIVGRARELREPVGGTALEGFERGVRFENVGFAYEDGRQVLAGVTLEVERGRTTAVVGPSGSGKTTVIDLLMRLLLPQSGDVVVDGVSMSELDASAWRRRIGYVAQDAVLFHTTVADNIALTSPGVPRERIVAAAKAAAAHEFIEAMPEGYDTVIGDRGMRLSGGQRQRLALARALARDPEILILDEATSALDAESEARILEAIDALPDDVTVLVVTHRLSTVKGADRIYVLEAGRVVESGSFDELAAAGGRFDELRKLQALEGSA